MSYTDINEKEWDKHAPNAFEWTKSEDMDDGGLFDRYMQSYVAIQAVKN